jgi:TPR repeat protein
MGLHSIAAPLIIALNRFQLAAKQRLAAAQNNLATCFQTGSGVEKDENEAVRLYRLAASQGLASASKNLAVCHHKGVGSLSVNMGEATRLYRSAALQGHAAAQGNLGWCYLQGFHNTTPKNRPEAVRLFELAYDLPSLYHLVIASHLFG